MRESLVLLVLLDFISNYKSRYIKCILWLCLWHTDVALESQHAVVLGCGQVEPGDHRPVGGQHLGDAPPDPAPGTRNDGDPALEPFDLDQRTPPRCSIGPDRSGAAAARRRHGHGPVYGRSSARRLHPGIACTYGPRPR